MPPPPPHKKSPPNPPYQAFFTPISASPKHQGVPKIAFSLYIPSTLLNTPEHNSPPDPEAEGAAF